MLNVAGSEMEAGEEEEEVEGEEEEEGEEQEEEAWLDALEAGEVNERGYLPHKQDSGSLTARQVSIIYLVSSGPCVSNCRATFLAVGCDGL